MRFVFSAPFHTEYSNGEEGSDFTVCKADDASGVASENRSTKHPDNAMSGLIRWSRIRLRAIEASLMDLGH